MEENIFLPIAKTPISSFSHQAAISSIMLAYKECEAWVYNNYIQLFSLRHLYGIRSGTIDFYYTDYCDFNSYEYTANPWIRFFEFPLSMIEFKDNKSLMIEKIGNRLKEGFYLQVEIDAYYISKYDMYQKKHFTHWLYIYGIDFDKEELLCMDNFKQFKFSYERISFDEIYEGIKFQYDNYKINRKTEIIGPTIIIFKVFPLGTNRDHLTTCGLDLKRIQTLLYDYLKGGRRNAYTSSVYYIYGMMVYISLQKYIEEIRDKLEFVDIRSICSLIDHKKIMIQRLVYISKVEEIDFMNEECEFNVIRRNLEKILLIALKYNIKRQPELLNDIIYRIDWIIDEEQKAISNLIKKLSILIN